MNQNTQKEEFSYGYLHTLASSCGYIFVPSPRPLDNHGIDLQILCPGSEDNGAEGRILAQVKCTSQEIDNGNFLKFPLPVNNYKQLIKRSIDLNLLIIVIVPLEIKEWIQVCEKSQKTFIKKCGYWISLENEKDTNNQTSITINIPKENILTPQSLKSLMETAKERKSKLLT